MRKRLLGMLLTGVVVVAACGGTTTTPAPATGAPATEAPATEAPATTAPTAEQTMNMVMDGDVSGGLTNAADNVPTAEAAQFLYDGLYVYDETLTPVPNLVTELAEVTEEGQIWTVKLSRASSSTTAPISPQTTSPDVRASPRARTAATTRRSASPPSSRRSRRSTT